MKTELHNIHIPRNLANLGGDFVSGQAKILGEKAGRGVAQIVKMDEAVDWLKAVESVYFQFLKDNKTLKVIRRATEEDMKTYRVPIWVQDEDAPICCDRPMIFVGQLDDDTLCTERPADAKMWWHDRASFYVFSCSQCLGVKAVGQQF